MEGLRGGDDVRVTGDVAPGRGRGRPDAGGGSDVRWSDRPLTSVKRVPLILALLASLLLFLAGTADSTSIKGKKGRKIARSVDVSRVKSRAAIRALCNRNQAAHSSGSPSERHARVKSTVRYTVGSGSSAGSSSSSLCLCLCVCLLLLVLPSLHPTRFDQRHPWRRVQLQPSLPRRPRPLTRCFTAEQREGRRRRSGRTEERANADVDVNPAVRPSSVAVA